MGHAMGRNDVIVHFQIFDHLLSVWQDNTSTLSVIDKSVEAGI